MLFADRCARYFGTVRTGISRNSSSDPRGDFDSRRITPSPRVSCILMSEAAATQALKRRESGRPPGLSPACGARSPLGNLTRRSWRGVPRRVRARIRVPRRRIRCAGAVRRAADGCDEPAIRWPRSRYSRRPRCGRLGAAAVGGRCGDSGGDARLVPEQSVWKRRASRSDPRCVCAPHCVGRRGASRDGVDRPEGLEACGSEACSRVAAREAIHGSERVACEACGACRLVRGARSRARVERASQGVSVDSGPSLARDRPAHNELFSSPAAEKRREGRVGVWGVVGGDAEALPNQHPSLPCAPSIATWLTLPVAYACLKD